MRTATLTPRFVEAIPCEIPEGVLFISEFYATAIHKCCCGCGREVVTPLSPVKWQLRCGPGNTVTLYPSIGNWNFPCRSHYWIRGSRVAWAGDMSARQVRAVQLRDRIDSESHIRLANREKIQKQAMPEHPRSDTSPSLLAPWFIRAWEWVINRWGS